jgi:cobalt/nickel transport system permease protein
MHLAEGMLPISQAVGFSAVTVPVLIWSMRGEQLERKDNASSSTVMASVTSLLFAATLLPLPVPIVGATSHICLTPLFALVVGLRRIIWPTFFVLLLQAVFFAHGGLTTLGINTLSLGVFGPLVTIGIWKLLLRLGSNSAIGLGIACGVGGLSVYILDALVLAVALSDVVRPETTFVSVLIGFAPVQVPLAILESVVSVKIIQILLNRRVDLLPSTLSTLRKSSVPAGAVLFILFASNLSGCDYEGIDGTVFGATAETAGRPPTDSLIDFSQGELGLAMSILILFGLGFVAGRSWERLLSEEHDALPR